MVWDLNSMRPMCMFLFLFNRKGSLLLFFFVCNC